MQIFTLWKELTFYYGVTLVINGTTYRLSMLVWNTENDSLIPAVSKVTISGASKAWKNILVAKSCGYDSFWNHMGWSAEMKTIMAMFARMWFNCGVACTTKKKEFINGNPISEELEL
jgi:hypothetical protein